MLYARTARHLRWEQWVYRPTRRVQRLFPFHARLVSETNPERRAALQAVVADWGRGNAAQRLERARAICEDRFTFLNHEEHLPAVDWRKAYRSSLWTYHLQYFDYAVDLAWAFRLTGNQAFVRRFEALSTAWVEQQRPGQGVGWEPYPVSLRIVNWTYALLLLGDSCEASIQARLVQSLGLQCAFLERRLELHLLANHLQKNFKALVVAGLLLRGDDAARWLRAGSEGLWRELDRQVLPDGGHFERSPMYHAIALADMLEVAGLMQACSVMVPDTALKRIRLMLRAYGALCRPDGSLHLFNDAANAIAPERDWIDQLARQVLVEPVADPSGIWELPETGYFGFADPEGADRFIIDCGIPGPTYQPGHAHCDLLSFELDIGGRPVVVDSGVAGYDGDPFREYVRSTRAHNTLMVAGLEQTEMWDTFRVARRANPLGAKHQETEGVYRFEGAYSPFHSRHIVHRRQVERLAAGWEIVDQIDGADGAQVASFLHLHPDCITEWRGRTLIARSGALVVHIEPFGFDAVELCRGRQDPPQGWHCPEFGKTIAAPCLEMQLAASSGRRFGFRIRTS